ncbi:MAG TPA: Gfo/Idh/MocA family oxidoreductase [Solirubrobacteraceae bacterium]|nr:Gfo/Idh/MocA family oxidoreductase [Solirubrobacteraceae bacterium]
MRLALAGLGSAAVRGHVPAIGHATRALTLVAAADPAADRRRETHALLDGLPVFDSAETMLAAIACDVLVVAAEPAAHADLVVLGLRHGVHVVCEKPLVVTQSDYDRILREHASKPSLGIVSMLQYRYSPTWRLIARCARLADRLRIPFALVFDVRRPGADPLAASLWRSAPEASGGMLADHGVHCVGLAGTVGDRLDVLASVRTCAARGERSRASLRVGRGVATIRVESGAPSRETTVTLHLPRAAIVWRDERVALHVGRRRVLSRRTHAISDRVHVDALYRPFYGDLARNLTCFAWRAQRTAESLVVARALLALLAGRPS